MKKTLVKQFAVVMALAVCAPMIVGCASPAPAKTSGQAANPAAEAPAGTQKAVEPRNTAVQGNDPAEFKTMITGGGVTITDYTGTGKAVVIPEKINNRSVGIIGPGAFLRKELTSVTIPNSVMMIADMAFGDNQLTSVTIPNSVKTIANNSFDANVKITRQ